MVGRIKCMNYNNLMKYAKEIIEHGGEGVILRKPKSLYEHGRTNSLIKFKVCLLFITTGFNSFVVFINLFFI